MSNRIGNPDVTPPYLKDIEVDTNVVSGNTSTYVYEGNEAELKIAADTNASAGATQQTFRPLGNGNFELRSTFPWGNNFFPGGTGQGETPTNTHELEINSLQPHLWGNPVLLRKINKASVGVVRQAVRDFENGTYPKSAGGNAQTDAEADITALVTDVAQRPFCIALFRQVVSTKDESYVEERHVYRRTLTASYYSQVQASYVGVGKIWSTPQVAEWESTPGTIFFALPANSVWFKSKPRVIAVAGQKTQISYHYTEAISASSLLYDSYQGGDSGIHPKEDTTLYLWYYSPPIP